MRARIDDLRDFLSGLMFAAFGVIALIVARNYPIGTPARMGAGFFPMLLGGALALLGLAIVAKSLRVERRAAHAEAKPAAPGVPAAEVAALAVWRPLVVVLGALASFALALPHLGLALSVVLLVLISALAEPGFRWRSAVPLAIVLAAIAVAVFRHGIGLPFRVWP